MKKNIIIVILSLCIVAGVFYFVKNNGNKPNDNDGNKVFILTKNMLLMVQSIILMLIIRVFIHIYQW